MYRISFSVKHSRFVVQMLFLGLFWISCKEDGEQLRFDTRSEADNWIRSIGLNEAYPAQTSRLSMVGYLERN